MFEYLQISNVRERYLVGLADIVLLGVAPLMRRRPSRSGGPARRILLLRLERIGDLLMALQAIRDVRRQAPQAQIDLIVGSWNAALANAIGDLDGVETLQPPSAKTAYVTCRTFSTSRSATRPTSTTGSIGSWIATASRPIN